MSVSLLVIIVLVLLCVGGFPAWGFSRGWGYGPSGIIGVILVVVIVLVLLGRF